MPRPEGKRNLRNITINIPDIYDKNLLKLQKVGLIPSRSEGVRLAIRQFLQNEYKDLKILGYFEWQQTEVKNSWK